MRTSRSHGVLQPTTLAASRGRRQNAAPPIGTGWFERYGPAAAVALCAALLYLQTLTFDLVWDDPISVHRWLPALDSFVAFFFPPPNIPQFPPDYYRPLQLLSYAVDRAVGGGAAWAFHLSSVLWHTGATALVYLVGRRLWQGEAIASTASFGAALLFAAHPIHTESVAWMAARPDPMVAVFLLGALYLALSAERVGFTCAATIALLALAALLSKENALAAIVLLPLAAWSKRQRTDSHQRLWKDAHVRATSAAVLAAALAYVALRYYGLTHYRGFAPTVAPTSVLALPAAVGWYASKLVWPFPQNALVAEVPLHSRYLLAAAAAAGASAALIFAGYRLRRRYYLLFVACFWCPLLPSLALLVMNPTAPLAERYLYVPSLAFSWVVAEGVARLAQRSPAGVRRAIAVTAAAALTALATATISRNRVWQDNIALWSDTAAKNPREGFPLRNLAAALLEQGRATEAERLLLQALERRNSGSGLYAIYSNLGTVAFLREDYQAAAEQYHKAFAQQATADAAYNLAAALLKAGERLPEPARQAQLLEARQWLERALAMSPYDAEVHFAYAQVAQLLADLDTARRHFQRALELGLREPQARQARVFLDGLAR